MFTQPSQTLMEQPRFNFKDPPLLFTLRLRVDQAQISESALIGDAKKEVCWVCRPLGARAALLAISEVKKSLPRIPDAAHEYHFLVLLRILIPAIFWFAVLPTPTGSHFEKHGPDASAHFHKPPKPQP